jgi:hypothetical protein
VALLNRTGIVKIVKSFKNSFALSWSMPEQEGNAQSGEIPIFLILIKYT